jgi:hypothetical protein
MTDAERKAVWRKLRGFRRSKEGRRRAELAVASVGRELIPEEAAELAALEAIDDALEKTLWDERFAYDDRLMAEVGLAWNEDHTEIIRKEA